MPTKPDQIGVAPASTGSSPVLPTMDRTLRDALEADIVARGIICPIIVSSDGQILDGRLREEIGKRHGLFVPRVVIGCLDSGEKADIRLVLNGLRRQMTQSQWREIVSWELRRAPERSDRSIAARIGVSHNTVSSTRRVLESNGQIDHCTRRTTADGREFPSRRKPIVIISSDRSAKEAAAMLEDVGDSLAPVHTSFRKLRFSAYQADRDRRTAAAKSVKLGDGIEVIARDFQKLGTRVEGESASLCLLDPPWGIEDAILRQPLAEVAYGLTQPGKYAAVYTGVVGIADFCRVFAAAGWVYRWTVVCERNSGVIVNGGMVLQRWTPIVIFQKPPGKFSPPNSLVDRIPSGGMEKTLHKWGQPTIESRYMTSAFTQPGDLVVDLTCGSASSAIGTLEAGKRRYFGSDIDRTMVKAARQRIADALKLQK